MWWTSKVFPLPHWIQFVLSWGGDFKGGESPFEDLPAMWGFAHQGEPMVTATQVALAIKLLQTGVSAYKQYKRSYKRKSKRKRNKMLNMNWGSKWKLNVGDWTQPATQLVSTWEKLLKWNLTSQMQWISMESIIAFLWNQRMATLMQMDFGYSIACLHKSSQTVICQWRLARLTTKISSHTCGELVAGQPAIKHLFTTNLLQAQVVTAKKELA